MDNSSSQWQMLKNGQDKNGGHNFEDIACRYVETVLMQFE